MTDFLGYLHDADVFSHVIIHRNDGRVDYEMSIREYDGPTAKLLFESCEVLRFFFPACCGNPLQLISYTVEKSKNLHGYDVNISLSDGSNIDFKCEKLSKTAQKQD